MTAKPQPGDVSGSGGPVEARAAAAAIAQECLATRARRLDRTLTRLYNDALRPYGVTSTQLALLVGLSLQEPVRPGVLGRGVGLEKSTVSRNVGRMIDSGWVTEIDGQDGRSKLLRLTDAGSTLVSRAYKGWRSAQERAKTVLSQGTAESLARLDAGLGADS
jgi:DNA-binding MarR family transcriptional regulator